MAKPKYDIGYIAAGAHELGHAQNLEKSRYPKVRTLATSVAEPIGAVVAPVGGLAARSRLGPAGGALVGGGLGFASHVPTLIEEHQASKRALRALRDSGQYSEQEYRAAQKLLNSAYRTYVTGALNSAAVGGAIGSAHIPTAVATLGAAKLNTEHTKKKHIGPVLQALRQKSPDNRKRIAALRRQMRLKTRISDANKLKDEGQAAGAFFIAPERHISRRLRPAYRAFLEEHLGPTEAKRIAAEGGAFIP